MSEQLHVVNERVSIERVFDAATSISTIPPPSDATPSLDISVFVILSDPSDTEMMEEERETELSPPVSVTSEIVSIPVVVLVTNRAVDVTVAVILVSVTSDSPVIVKAVPVRDICTPVFDVMPPRVNEVEME